jgi:hypothetical protein
LNIKTGRLQMSVNLKNKQFSITGVILTILVSIGFIWAAAQWFNRYKLQPELNAKNIWGYQVKTFNNLQLIREAQEKYKAVDWDEDGKKVYAKFFVHLWTTVNRANEPILIKFIPRKLAFAMAASRAVDGYYFIDLRGRTLPKERQIRRLDYEKEWAILGVPTFSRGQDTLFFLVDNTGHILAKKQRGIPLYYPYDPISEGWSKIDSIGDLKKFGLDNSVF